jgi:hypothetical protein
MEMSVKTVVKTYVRHHYGNLISVGEPKFNPDEKQWVAELLSDYPRIIHDDRHPGERTLKFLTLRRLGTVKVGENLSQNSIDATTRNDCVETLSAYLKLWQERADRVIIRASSDNLARTSSAQTFLGKIGAIVSRLERKDIIFDSEIDNFPEKEASKIRRYLQLLEGLEIVEHRENGYSYGNMYTELSHVAQNTNVDLNTAILSHIIKNRYSALKETFRITHLEPVVHVDSLYYRPVLEADEIIYWKYESFEHHCNMLYGSGSKISFRLPFILDELVHVQALKYEDRLYFGNDALWKQMREEVNMREFSLPRA